MRDTSSRREFLSSITKIVGGCAVGASTVVLGYHYAPKYEVKTIRLEESYLETKRVIIAIEGSLTKGSVELEEFKPYKITKTGEISPVFYVIPTIITRNTATFEVYFSNIDLGDYEFVRKEEFRGKYKLTKGSTERIKINPFDKTVYS